MLLINPPQFRDLMAPTVWDSLPNRPGVLATWLAPNPRDDGIALDATGAAALSIWLFAIPGMLP